MATKTPAAGNTPPTFQNTLDTQFGTGNPFAPSQSANAGQADIGRGANTASGASGALSGLANMSTSNQWYGDSPIATAQAQAQRMLEKNLGGLRARYGASGGGNSARAGLAESNAIGEATTGLGAQLAQLGIGARQGDISNAIGAQTNAGNLGLGVGNIGLGAGNLYNNQQNTALNAVLGAGQQNLAGQQLDLDRTKLLADQGNALTGVGANEQNIPNLGALTAFISALAGGTTTGGASGSSKTRPF